MATNAKNPSAGKQLNNLGVSFITVWLSMNAKSVKVIKAILSWRDLPRMSIEEV